MLLIIHFILTRFTNMDFLYCSYGTFSLLIGLSFMIWFLSFRPLLLLVHICLFNCILHTSFVCYISNFSMIIDCVEDMLPKCLRVYFHFIINGRGHKCCYRQSYFLLEASTFNFVMPMSNLVDAFVCKILSIH